jgi:hypothetical protein
MSVSLLSYNIQVDEKTYTDTIGTLENNEVLNIINDCIELKLLVENKSITPIIKNAGKSNVFLNSLELELDHKGFSDFKSYAINAENPKECIFMHDLDKNRKNINTSSFLFTVFLGKYQFHNRLIGFTGCERSKNFINISCSRTEPSIRAVYRLGKQEIMPGEELTLDSIYEDFGASYVQLIAQYTKVLNTNRGANDAQLYAQSHSYKDVSNIECIEDLLFTDKPRNFSLKVDDKPLSIKVGKTKLYPINLAAEEGAKYIFERIQAIAEANKCVNFTNIYPYIEQVEKYCCSNIYGLINNMFSQIKRKHPKLIMAFDDCPLPIMMRMNFIIIQEFDLTNKKSLIGRIKSKSNIYCENYDFITKTIFQRLALSHFTKYKTEGVKERELLEVLTGDTEKSHLNNSALIDIGSDIKDNAEVFPYIDKDNVFAFLVKGKTATYFAILNLSQEDTKFFWDFSMFEDAEVSDGVGVEVFTNKSYLISNSKLYIRVLPHKECFLIKKAVNND